MKKLIFFVLLITICISPVYAQKPLNEFWEQAFDAWDTGDFIPALEDFRKMLNSPMADVYFEDIALITGELYKVTEISKDGSSLKFSPDSRFITYEREVNGKTITFIFDIRDKVRQHSEFEGKNAEFSPDEKEVAYFRVQETAEVKQIRRELLKTMQESPGDRRAIFGKRREVSWIEAKNTQIVLRNIDSGREVILPDGGLLKESLLFNDDGSEILFVGGEVEVKDKCDVYAVNRKTSTPRLITSGPGFKANPVSVKGGKYLIYSVPSRSPLPQPASTGSMARYRRAPAGKEFAIINLGSGEIKKINGTNPSVSADGSTLAYSFLGTDSNEIFTVQLDGDFNTKSVKKTPERIESAGLSPDGRHVIYSMFYRRNFDVFTVRSDGKEEKNISNEIQHDRFPRFISNTKILYAKGEGRHRRSYIYDMLMGETVKLFHNNTLRTIAPEYEWTANPDGTKVLIQSERDGDTISPERAVYLVDLTQKITKEELSNRIDENLKTEKALRAKGERMFRPIFNLVKDVVEKVSLRKIYEYEEVLFSFDSKYITEPGNKPAGDYIFNTLKSFGYEPEYQWFEARNVRTANILATLPGTENPELIYVLSSHYDSNRRCPGADDNTSAVAVLLETARILRNTPMSATIIFAAFTGEEAGLLGSRHYVQEAVKNKLKLVGALNNDMIGWANDHHLDNTIRYSNAGIRDVQHAGAFLFSKMVTYDAHYYKSTDAAAYYEAYGDIVGGIGSYPVLGNPYYHQPEDLLETVNHQLLYEATQANTAALMLLASSPSRINGLTIKSVSDDGIDISWEPSPEKSVTYYKVKYGTKENPGKYKMTVNSPEARIKIAPDLKGKTIHIAVKAYNSAGLEGWDWAQVTCNLE